MSKWEYKTFTSTGGLRIAVEESSSLGEDGWELVTINTVMIIVRGYSLTKDKKNNIGITRWTSLLS